jgi:LysM repeat protein
MVTVAATGAGLALPLIGAGAAHAAGTGTWDKVAICETGGLWSADTHNGFYGGLAITQDTWGQYGGTAYAHRPDLASRSQQIAVAERILADLGPGAWPGCEKGTGLLKDTGKPDVDPGGTVTATPAPDLPADPGTPTDDAGTPTSTPTGPATPADPGAPITAPPATTAPADPATGTATPAPSSPGTPARTTPPASPDDPTAPGTPTTGGGRHAKPYSPTDDELAAADQATRTEVTAFTANTLGANNPHNTGNTDASADTTPGAYKVGAGDSLSGIAADHHVAGGWDRLYDVNHQVIGDNPNLIKPGQIISLG